MVVVVVVPPEALVVWWVAVAAGARSEADEVTVAGAAGAGWAMVFWWPIFESVGGWTSMSVGGADMVVGGRVR